MYFHITEKCNMNCPHCCFAYGRNHKNAKDMPFEMFKKIVDDYSPLIRERDWYIALGGGEPTLHPKFWKILTYALSKGFPWLATNGSKKEDALMLCDLAKKGKISVALSQDEWHDPIDPEVIEAFQEGLGLKEYDGYRTHLYYLRNVDKKEVDFLVTVDDKPWFCVEAKLNDTNPSPSLFYFKERLNIPYTYQVVRKQNVDILHEGIRVISAHRFLASLI